MSVVTNTCRSLPPSSSRNTSGGAATAGSSPRRRGRGLALLAAASIAASGATLGAGAATPAAASSGPGILWSNHFDFGLAGVSEWGGHIGVHGGTRVVGAPGGKEHRALSVMAPGRNNGYTSKAVDKRPTFASLGISSRDDAWLRYRVFFPDDFSWYEGGKLPGLSGISGGKRPFDYPNDNSLDRRSWNGKIMWVTDGKLKSYLFVPSAAGVDLQDNRSDANDRMYGIMESWRQGANPNGEPMALRKGRWNTIDLHYRMNTPGRNDGVFEGYLDGELGVRLTDVQYRGRSHPDLDINLLAFSSFFGGPTANRTDERWYFDDVTISSSRLDR